MKTYYFTSIKKGAKITRYKHHYFALERSSCGVHYHPKDRGPGLGISFRLDDREYRILLFKEDVEALEGFIEYFKEQTKKGDPN